MGIKKKYLFKIMSNILSFNLIWKHTVVVKSVCEMDVYSLRWLEIIKNTKLLNMINLF